MCVCIGKIFLKMKEKFSQRRSIGMQRLTQPLVHEEKIPVGAILYGRQEFF